MNEPIVTVVIELSLPLSDLSDFQEQWEQYREALCEFAGIEKAQMIIPVVLTPTVVELDR